MWGEDNELEFRVCFQLEMPQVTLSAVLSPQAGAYYENRRGLPLLPATVSITVVSTHNHH